MKEGLEIIFESRGKRFLFAVETSDRADDYAKYEELRETIWRDPRDCFASVRNMAGDNFFHDGSCLYIGIFKPDDKGCFPRNKDHMIGFAYGYVGVRDKVIAFSRQDNLVFYSQYAGIHPDYQNYDLGIKLKSFQQEIVMGVLGVNIITCTYDPLTAVNAYRNIHKFGMDVVTYQDAYYTGFFGKLNRIDVPSDRFFVSWDLKKEVRLPHYDLLELLQADQAIIVSKVTEVTGKNGIMRLPIPVRKNFTAAKDLSPPHLVLLEIPYDFYTMLRETDVPAADVRIIPLNWRLETRAAFHRLFAAGYKIVDFRCLKTEGRLRDFYVLAAPAQNP